MTEAEEDVLARVLWRRRSHKAQRKPAGDWRTWVFLGGRGAGKTRAGAEWVWETAQRLGKGGRIALVGPTIRDARTVMVEGPSGVMNLPFREGARFASSLRQVRFPGGAVGLLFSAEEPERLRGPQFHAAWGDEFCAWAYGEETLAMLRLGLRLGEGPRLVLTSTPKPGRVLRGVLAEDGCARTDAPTRVNAKNLAPGFLAAMEGLYGGTRRAAQELEGRVLESDGALFTLAEIERARAGWEAFSRSPSPEVGRDVGAERRQGGEFLAYPTRSLRDHPPHEGEGERVLPLFDRVVVAVDPPAGTLSGRARDACGIVVAGRRGDRAAVLADWTARGLSPEGWADRVRRAAEAFGAHRVVVESNNGGAMAEAVLKASGLSVAVKRVHASVGKVARAEPVAALYEQGRVVHAPGLEALEEELMGLGSEDAGGSSPDRADALVWAVTALMPTPGTRGPRLTQL
ncbi:terminase large subunit domain-containing protein [Brevundimonas sp.]|uniref:terminase large subunit domain-containing protein n=1 Tax=Brevundimonas sp. TaxID=1871086 RepID=UPI002FC8629E